MLNNRLSCYFVLFLIPCLFLSIGGCSTPSASGGSVNPDSMMNSNVSDDSGTDDVSSEWITVRGPDRTGPGSSIVLDASLSADSDPASATYEWKQISGPSVELANTKSSYLNITIPELTEDAEVVLEVSITFHTKSSGQRMMESERFTVSVSSSYGNGDTTTNNYIIQADPQKEGVPTTVLFSVVDSDGNVHSEDHPFTWYFGDGERGEGATVSYSYATAGEYQISLYAREVEYVTATAVPDAEYSLVIAEHEAETSSDAELSISPSNTILVAITEGGSIEPNSWTYTLSNTGGTELQWKCENESSHLELASESGSISPGESIEIKAQLTQEVLSLDEGHHTCRLLFKDITNNKSIWRSVSIDTGESTEEASDEGEEEEEEEEEEGLTVEFPASLVFSMEDGGDLDDSEYTITLTNKNSTPISWSTDFDADWFQLSKSSGTLIANQEDTIRLSLADPASEQGPGFHRDTLTITSDFNSASHSKTVQLMIGDGIPDEPPRFVPWIELSSLRSEYYDPAVEGINVWSEITNTACVITRPDEELLRNLFSSLEADCPGMTIIPCLKTHFSFTTDEVYIEDGDLIEDHVIRLDSLQGWQDFVYHLDIICEETGTDIIYIDNETTNKHLIWNYYTPDWDKIEQGIQLVEECSVRNNVEINWYPPIMGLPGTLTRERTQRFHELLVENVSQTGIVTFGWATKADVRSDAAQELYTACKALDIPYTNVCYFLGEYAGRDNDWEAEDIHYLLENCDNTDFFFIYPTLSRLSEIGYGIIEELSDEDTN